MTFHPDHEIPILRRWYHEYPNPTSDRFASFAYELNKGHVRQDRPKVTAQKVKVWWKNERQRERRLQISAEKKPDVDEKPGASSHAGSEGGKGRCRKRSRSKSGLGSGSGSGSMPRRSVGSTQEEMEEEEEELEEGEVVILGCDDEGEGIRPHGSPPTWGRKPEKTGLGQGRGHSHGHGQRSAFTASAPSHPLALPYSKPPPPHKSGKHLPAPLGAEPTFTVSTGTDPPGHTLFPGSGSGSHAPASWQPHFLSWTGMQRGRSPEMRDAGVSPESAGLLPGPGWQQPRFQLLRGSGSGSRSEEEREEVTAGGGEGVMGERYRYAPTMDISPYPPSSSGSMDFSNIL